MRIAGPDRRGLERFCRYVARLALASGLRILDSERLSFALRTPWSDGRVIFYSRPLNYSRSGRLWSPRPGSISYATTVSFLAPRARDRDSSGPPWGP